MVGDFYQDDQIRVVVEIDGSAEKVKIYRGSNFQILDKTIEGDAQFKSNNRMRINVIARQLKAGTDFFFDGFKRFDENLYSGDFGNHYILIVLDEDKSNPANHKLTTFYFQMVKGESDWYATAPQARFTNYKVSHFS